MVKEVNVDSHRMIKINRHVLFCLNTASARTRNKKVLKGVAKAPSHTIVAAPGRHPRCGVTIVVGLRMYALKESILMSNTCVSQNAEDCPSSE